jgi:hypothetical protein
VRVGVEGRRPVPVARHGAMLPPPPASLAARARLSAVPVAAFALWIHPSDRPRPTRGARPTHRPWAVARWLTGSLTEVEIGFLTVVQLFGSIRVSRTN